MAPLPDGPAWKLLADRHHRGPGGIPTGIAAAREEGQGEVNVPEATDRQSLSRTQPLKPRRWPRTERRQARIRSVLTRRQPDLTVVLENVHDPHNVSAILRSCDGVGVLRVHAVYSVEEPPQAAFARQTSASAAKWVEVEQHRSLADCYKRLREEGFSILATSIRPGSRPLYDWDLRKPVALVLGNEMRGVSREASDMADGAIQIPMVGMVESLNVSVACAVCLYETLRQRTAAGDYEVAKLDSERLRALEDEWLRR
jgi:tRNA (guanosine-2'-O-)-methyltransferase